MLACNIPIVIIPWFLASIALGALIGFIGYIYITSRYVVVECRKGDRERVLAFLNDARWSMLIKQDAYLIIKLTIDSYYNGYDTGLEDVKRILIRKPLRRHIHDEDMAYATETAVRIKDMLKLQDEAFRCILVKYITAFVTFSQEDALAFLDGIREHLALKKSQHK